jgi:hypothetical protein
MVDWWSPCCRQHIVETLLNIYARRLLRHTRHVCGTLGTADGVFMITLNVLHVLQMVVYCASGLAEAHGVAAEGGLACRMACTLRVQ